MSSYVSSLNKYDPYKHRIYIVAYMINREIPDEELQKGRPCVTVITEQVIDPYYPRGLKFIKFIHNYLNAVSSFRKVGRRKKETVCRQAGKES